MSDVPVVPGPPVIAQTKAPQKLSAIQLIEQEIGQFMQRHAQAIAQVHNIEGAIQYAQQLLLKLKAEEAKAQASPVVQQAEAAIGSVVATQLGKVAKAAEPIVVDALEKAL